MDLLEQPLQRDTQFLNKKEAIIDLNNIRQISILSNQKKFGQIQSLINQIINNTGKVYYPQSLKAELLYLKIFYNSISSDNHLQLNLTEEENKQLQNYKMRLFQLFINMKIKQGILLENNQVNELIALVEKNPSFKEEIMIKTVGCRSIKTMIRISKQQIELLTQDFAKMAIKYQIASDWKYIIGAYSQSLALKKESLQIWNKINRPNRSLDTKQELQCLKRMCQNKKIETPYANKLKNMRKIVTRLEKIADPTDKEISIKNLNKESVKTMFSQFLSSIEVKEKDQQVNNNSIFKKQGVLDERLEIGKLFKKKSQKNNFYYNDFIPENRFTEANKKKLIRIFGKILLQKKKIQRLFFDKIKPKKK